MAEDESFLIGTDIYFKSGIHIGTKFRTKYMQDFIYKIRNDGLAILNIQHIDRRLRIAADFLAQYSPDDIVVACRRENGWKGVKGFAKATGCTAFTGRYQPGMFTNINLETFREAKVLVICDPVPDRNAIKDAMSMGMVIVGLCDTNNESNEIDLVIPCNNKGRSSLGMVFYLLAREYAKKKGKELEIPMEDFLE